MMMPAGSVFIQNFGCRVNQAEAFDWAAEFHDKGWILEAEPARSALIVVNSCTLTSRADRDVRRFIRKVARENPRARIVVTGCLAERDPEGLNAMPGVWKVVPNADKPALPARCFENGLGRVSGFAAPSDPPGSYRARALVKVQDGCDMACAFCVIPSVRGRSASRPVKAVLSRIEGLVSSGYHEIILSGIHLCSYGRDLNPRSSLLELLTRIEALSGEFRVRLSSLDPRLLPFPFLDFLASSRRVVPHFHLSFQHGSDRILKAMGRESTAGGYRDLAGRFVRLSPEACLGSDFIVGFPGETERDFEATAALLEETPLAYAHVFSFSARPGTKAAEDRAVEPAKVKSRAVILRRLSGEKNLAYRRRFSGRMLPGIVIQRKPGGLEILTSNYLEVIVPDGRQPEGAAVLVRIATVGERSTTGEICDNETGRP
ncbi:MAG: MiaB/RimO family radical SAM methylthiotransferase [Candidatus Aminicenantes bacterium]|nr:MiaB/RimO family radical SAM methylthiotransferase [Candidatus Aminicenantes bacterium]